MKRSWMPSYWDLSLVRLFKNGGRQLRYLLYQAFPPLAGLCRGISCACLLILLVTIGLIGVACKENSSTDQPEHIETPRRIKSPDQTHIPDNGAIPASDRVLIENFRSIFRGMERPAEGGRRSFDPNEEVRLNRCCGERLDKLLAELGPNSPSAPFIGYNEYWIYPEGNVAIGLLAEGFGVEIWRISSDGKGCFFYKGASVGTGGPTYYKEFKSILAECRQ